MDTATELLFKFRTAAIQAGDVSNPKAQNKAAIKLQDYYKSLCQTDEGKNGIIGLMSDPDPGVRLSAASRSLQWMPEQAQKVLEELRTTQAFPISFEAEMTLEEYRKGRLSFDY